MKSWQLGDTGHASVWRYKADKTQKDQKNIVASFTTNQVSSKPTDEQKLGPINNTSPRESGSTVTISSSGQADIKYTSGTTALQWLPWDEEEKNSNPNVDGETKTRKKITIGELLN